jgi:tetratricopeptide (TPR) repeat protein
MGLFAFNIDMGRYIEAEAIWTSIHDSKLETSLPRHLQCNFKRWYAILHFFQRTLEEEELISVEHFARENRSRQDLRRAYQLRGDLQMQHNQWSLAAESFQEALRMARESQRTDLESEARLCLAKFHLGQLPDPREAANRLSQSKKCPPLYLAQLWLAIGDVEEAEKYALAAYRLAWADGEPYAYHYYLNEARSLLNQLGKTIPMLPPYDPAKDERFPWEADVIAAIEKLRAEANNDSDESES